MFEKAKWISPVWKANNRNIEKRPAPLLRRAFFLCAEVEKATLYIAGLGMGTYTINGIAVTKDVLVTVESAFDKSVYYTAYDVTALLREGENVFGAMLGNGTYNLTYRRWTDEAAPWVHHPKLIMELHIMYQDGKEETVVSDSAFETADGPIVYNETRRGEIYDARLEIPGWDTPGFDSAGWGRAMVCRSPGGILREAKIQPIRVIRTLPLKKVSYKVYDAGENTSGWVRIRVQGKRGGMVIVRYAEELDIGGNIAPDRTNGMMGAQTHKDIYILRGEGIETWAPRFTYHGFRYAEIECHGAELLEAVAEVVHTDLPILADFSCSDEMLCKIHAATRRATLTNFHGLPTDCPQREQNGWTGDAQVSAEQTIFNYDMEEAYSKWMQDIADMQRPSGQVPSVVPTAGAGYYNWGSGVTFDCALILIPWYFYTYTGSIRLLMERYENMERLMDFFASMEEQGIVEYGLGDWSAPEGAKPCPVGLTDTAYYYACALAMKECARAIGKDGTDYGMLAAEIRENFRRRYVKDGMVESDSQTAYAMALYFGLLEEPEKPTALARLLALIEEKDMHIDCGIFGTKCMFSVLSENGYADVMYKMVTNPTMPSYAFWINRGMTTLCERWGMMYSLNHHMFSEVDLWLYKYVAGIRSGTAVGEAVSIEPCFLEGLTWAEARRGEIAVSWNAESVSIESPRAGKLFMEGETYPFEAGRHIFPRK